MQYESHATVCLPACLSLLSQPLRRISADAFRRAADEFSSCQLDRRLGVKQLNDLVCPACSKGSWACHIDSNMKLFVWDRMRQEWREPHFREFFAESAEVQLTIKAVDAARVSGWVMSAVKILLCALVTAWHLCAYDSCCDHLRCDDRSTPGALWVVEQRSHNLCQCGCCSPSASVVQSWAHATWSNCPCPVVSHVPCLLCRHVLGLTLRQKTGAATACGLQLVMGSSGGSLSRL